MAIVINGSTGISATESSNLLGDGVVEAADLASGAAVSNIGYTPANQSNVMGRNRIINGDMRIDQRNAGASVTPANAAYVLDRWRTETSGGGVYTVQQSSTAPTGFTNSMLITVTTADASIAASDYYSFEQFVEGYNVYDLGWGTANAKSVTLSFQVRSSVTGTYAGSFMNSANNRAYVFTYTINAANTFEQKTITIPGDTSGTWLTNNGRGIRLCFDLGYGSTYQTTAGSWTSGYYVGTASSVKLISTLGATFYITGVQLEIGSVATEFERRPYGTELMLCQRYYQILYSTTDSLMLAARGDGGSGTGCLFAVPLAVPLRASPTVTTGTLSFFDTDSNSSSTSATTVSMWDARNAVISLYNNGFTGTSNNRVAAVTPTSSTGIQMNSEL